MQYWTMSGEATDGLGYAISKIYREGKKIERIEVAGDGSFKWFDIFVNDGTKVQFFYTNPDDWTVLFLEEES